MKPRIAKFLSGAKLKSSLPRMLAFGLLVFWFAGSLVAQETRSDLTVHEWGTFTAVAGKHGQAIEWKPLTEFTDLPGFIEHLSSANLKLGLRGTIRMETPVMYFYSPREQTVSVAVSFSKGIITEWFPRAARVQPSGILRSTKLSQLQTDGTITWDGIKVSPNTTGEFPREAPANRYYAARETSAAPLRVKTSAGEQQERFLFYRGVSAAALPLSAELETNGALLVRNLSEGEIPAIILFERRGEHVGYRLERSPGSETTLESPTLAGSVDSLCSDLEGILVDQGLYWDEAHAMVETWRDSWFEEGTRLIYIVPRDFIDKVLPLAVQPAPAQMVRVFVGRFEIVTPATANAVQAALASHDEKTLKTYGRFLEPIQRILQDEHPESAQNIHRGLRLAPSR